MIAFQGAFVNTATFTIALPGHLNQRIEHRQQKMNMNSFIKHLFVRTFSAILLFSVFYPASFSHVFNKPEKPLHPQLKTDTNIIRYDTIIQHSKTTRRITITNQGNVALRIFNIRSSCGISVPSWPRQLIEPGEKAFIQMRYDASNPGPINRKIIIHSNSPEETKIIKVKGYVIPKEK